VASSENIVKQAKKRVFLEVVLAEFDHFSMSVYSALQPLCFHNTTSRYNRQNRNRQLGLSSGPLSPGNPGERVGVIGKNSFADQNSLTRQLLQIGT
jgi:hypothetical protein